MMSGSVMPCACSVSTPMAMLCATLARVNDGTSASPDTSFSITPPVGWHGVPGDARQPQRDRSVGHRVVREAGEDHRMVTGDWVEVGQAWWARLAAVIPALAADPTVRRTAPCPRRS